MITAKNNSISVQSRKLHNPKSNSPALFIPCWLSQISTSLLSNGAKLVYGRLAQWTNEKGNVYRSSPQLSQELGIPQRSIERHIQELKEIGLIGTYKTKAGGTNHFEFYDHDFMHEPIKEELIYKQEDSESHAKISEIKNLSLTPRQNGGTPRQNGGTPTPPTACINIKEIKSKNNNKTHPLPPQGESEGFKSFWEIYPVKTAKQDCLKYWQKEKLDKKAFQILVNLQNQITGDDKFLRGYARNPLKYLKQEGWSDPITFSKPVFVPKYNQQKAYDHDNMNWAIGIEKDLF